MIVQKFKNYCIQSDTIVGQPTGNITHPIVCSSDAGLEIATNEILDIEIKIMHTLTHSIELSLSADFMDFFND